MFPPHSGPSIPILARHGGFTLVEMIVVIMIIGLIMGIGIPGIFHAQQRVSANSTVNLIQGVHESCLRNTRQLGSAGLVYGYTLEFTDTTVFPGRHSAATIRPWIIVEQTSGPATVQYQQPGCDFRSDLGHGNLWNGDRLRFIDRQRPCGEVILDGVAIPTANLRYLHVAYEPRSGFVHAQMTNAPQPSFPMDANGNITLPAMPDTLVIENWIGVGRTTSQPDNSLVIYATGICDVHSP